MKTITVADMLPNKPYLHILTGLRVWVNWKYDSDAPLVLWYMNAVTGTPEQFLGRSEDHPVQEITE